MGEEEGEEDWGWMGGADGRVLSSPGPRGSHWLGKLVVDAVSQLPWTQDHKSCFLCLSCISELCDGPLMVVGVKRNVAFCVGGFAVNTSFEFHISSGDFGIQES